MCGQFFAAKLILAWKIGSTWLLYLHIEFVKVIIINNFFSKLFSFNEIKKARPIEHFEMDHLLGK